MLEAAFAGGGGARDEEWGLDATRREESAGERSSRAAGERRSRATAMDGCGFRFGGRPSPFFPGHAHALQVEPDAVADPLQGRNAFKASAFCCWSLGGVGGVG
jgi:hypothetical protein